MRRWLFLMGGLLVWTVHFFGIYAIASILLDNMLSRVLILLLTLLCLGANALLLWWTVPRSNGKDALSGWTMKMAAWGAGFSSVAVLWQGLPALLA